jgi:hypothetical protein
MRRRACRAIISSSLVGIAQAETRLPAALMRGPPFGQTLYVDGGVNIMA